MEMALQNVVFWIQKHPETAIEQNRGRSFGFCSSKVAEPENLAMVPSIHAQ